MTDRIDLPDEIKALFFARCDALNNELNAIRTRTCYLVDEALRIRDMTLKFNVGERARWSIEALQIDSLVQAINDLTLDGDGHPFFTEANLYELLGKENARTVLALMDRIKKRIDPITVK